MMNMKATKAWAIVRDGIVTFIGQDSRDLSPLRHDVVILKAADYRAMQTRGDTNKLIERLRDRARWEASDKIAALQNRVAELEEQWNNITAVSKQRQHLAHEAYCRKGY